MVGKTLSLVVFSTLCRRKHTMSTIYRPVKVITSTSKGNQDDNKNQIANLSKSLRVSFYEFFYHYNLCNILFIF